MNVIQTIVFIIWILFGVFRYLIDDLESDVTVYKWYTILVHGPFWWILAICQLIFHGIERINWSWLDNIFKIEKK